MRAEERDISAHVFVELRYFNLARERSIERFVTQFVTSEIMPVEKEPEYDEVIRLADFRVDDTYDFKALNRRVGELLNDGS
ncbi:MAG: hypothetical protein HY000_10825 [Planctomycetes bacterium]|nr:hypothetical protein [Planctomycetota bacterium]